MTKKAKPTTPRMHCPRSPGKGKAMPGRKAQATTVEDDSGGPALPDTGKDFWMKMGNMMKGVEERMKEETGRVVEEKMSLAFTKIDDLSSRLTTAERTVEDIVGGIGELVGKKVEEHLQNQGRAGPLVPGDTGDPGSYASVLKTSASKTQRAPRSKSGDYWACRKSLRIRPLGDGDGPQAARKYFREVLRLDERFIDDLGPLSVQRIPSGPGSEIQGEAVVSFTSVDARDAVKGAARNLAGRGQDYGIRHEVPNHLKSSLKSLHTLSYNIKQRHPDARRNVLFEDETMELVLDVCLESGGKWRRITSAQARSRARKISVGNDRMAIADDELDEILTPASTSSTSSSQDH